VNSQNLVNFRPEYILGFTAAHIWAENLVIKQLQVHSVNVTFIEVELMTIHTGLIPAMEIDNIHDITIITDSIATARKILESVRATGAEYSRRFLN